MQRRANGSTFIEISNSQVRTIPVKLPSKAAQVKIARFLSLIDLRIEVQNKIISELISLKNRIRPQPNAQIRFSEIATHHSSTLSLSNVKENGNYSVYGANGLCGYSDNYQFDFPAIAIVKDGAGVGRLIKISNTKYSIIGTMNLLEPRGVSIDYLYLVMHNINFKKYIVGSGIPHIYFGDYKSELVPSPNEQNLRLANLLSLVEKKIANESEVLQQYIRQKGYLLSNLFI